MSDPENPRRRNFIVFIPDRVIKGLNGKKVPLEENIRSVLEPPRDKKCPDNEKKFSIRLLSSIEGRLKNFGSKKDVETMADDLYSRLFRIDFEHGHELSSLKNQLRTHKLLDLVCICYESNQDFGKFCERVRQERARLLENRRQETGLEEGKDGEDDEKAGEHVEFQSAPGLLNAKRMIISNSYQSEDKFRQKKSVSTIKQLRRNEDLFPNAQFHKDMTNFENPSSKALLCVKSQNLEPGPLEEEIKKVIRNSQEGYLNTRENLFDERGLEMDIFGLHSSQKTRQSLFKDVFEIDSFSITYLNSAFAKDLIESLLQKNDLNKAYKDFNMIFKGIADQEENRKYTCKSNVELRVVPLYLKESFVFGVFFIDNLTQVVHLLTIDFLVSEADGEASFDETDMLHNKIKTMLRRNNYHLTTILHFVREEKKDFDYCKQELHRFIEKLLGTLKDECFYTEPDCLQKIEKMLRNSFNFDVYKKVEFNLPKQRSYRVDGFESKQIQPDLQNEQTRAIHKFVDRLNMELDIEAFQDKEGFNISLQGYVLDNRKNRVDPSLLNESEAHDPIENRANSTQSKHNIPPDPTEMFFNIGKNGNWKSTDLFVDDDSEKIKKANTDDFNNQTSFAHLEKQHAPDTEF